MQTGANMARRKAKAPETGLTVQPEEGTLLVPRTPQLPEGSAPSDRHGGTAISAGIDTSLWSKHVPPTDTDKAQARTIGAERYAFNLQSDVMATLLAAPPVPDLDYHRDCPPELVIWMQRYRRWWASACEQFKIRK